VFRGVFVTYHRLLNSPDSHDSLDSLDLRDSPDSLDSLDSLDLRDSPDSLDYKG